MKHILLVCALGQEMQIVKSTLKGKFWKGFRLHFFVCGLGMEISSIVLTKYLSTCSYSFDLVINIGVAGFFSPDASLQLGQVVQCFRILQGDANKELCVPPQYILPDIDILPVASFYRPVFSAQRVVSLFSYQENFLVDMEAYSIESVVSFFKIPRIFIKVLSDDIQNNKNIDHQNIKLTFQKSLQYLPSLLNSLFLSGSFT